MKTEGVKKRSQIRYMRYVIRGKGTDREKKIKLEKPVKLYYEPRSQLWVTIPDRPPLG